MFEEKTSKVKVFFTIIGLIVAIAVFITVLSFFIEIVKFNSILFKKEEKTSEQTEIRIVKQLAIDEKYVFEPYSNVDVSLIQFSSQDENVATVSASGEITAIYLGKTEIIATCKGKRITVLELACSLVTISVYKHIGDKIDDKMIEDYFKNYPKVVKISPKKFNPFLCTEKNGSYTFKEKGIQEIWGYTADKKPYAILRITVIN